MLFISDKNYHFLVSKLSLLSCCKYKKQCNLLITIYDEINKLQIFQNKLKRRQLLSHLWYHKTDVKSILLTLINSSFY